MCPELEQRLELLERRIVALEEHDGDRDLRIERMAEEITFVNKLVGDSRSSPGRSIAPGRKASGRKP